MEEDIKSTATNFSHWDGTTINYSTISVDWGTLGYRLSDLYYRNEKKSLPKLKLKNLLDIEKE